MEHNIRYESVKHTWVHLNKWGYLSCICCSSSHEVSSTPWFCHKTFTSRIVLVLNYCSLRSRICTRNSSYVRLGWISRGSWLITSDGSWIHFRNWETWKTSWTPTKLGGISIFYAKELTCFNTLNGPTYLGLSLPLLPKRNTFRIGDWCGLLFTKIYQ
jgi:hypothetical protein